MKTMTLFTCIAIASVVVGCGGDVTPTTAPPAPTPLGIAEWRELPVAEKYDETTFDRLRLQDPKLKNDRNWARFMVETVIPERKRDLPDDLPG